ncbi:MAG: aminotransferase class V-fold PLP-dependent enzyme [Chloroflexota bacterium]|nr:aminotransferase class V-fold PLP-dependent enzyme [Chloroflexota bacterium]
MTQHDRHVRTPAYDPDGYARTLAAFEENSPDFVATRALDDLRTREYGRLDRTGQIYLDYTGGGLYADSQVREHMELLAANVYGNPHSNNPTSLASTDLVDRARAAVFEFFNASPDEYAVIFTANASGALKLVGESYPFAPGSHYLLTYDNHNSVNGIREFARSRGAAVTYLPVQMPDMRLDPDRLIEHLDMRRPGGDNLFSYPAQSNFSGVQHSLTWIEEAQERGWDVLLDSAAFAPTNRLDLGRWKPDFVPLSFYKMFGYPTGVGALIARRQALKKLRRPWFAGGTITIASVQGEGWHYLIDGEAGFEDGTVNYLMLPGVEIGLRHLAAIGLDTIHTRVMSLTGWLLEQLHELRHSNGALVVRIFGPLDLVERGATIALNFLDPDGEPVDFRHTERLAAAANISLRTGCFCNPGAGEIAHEIPQDLMAGCFKSDTPVSYAELYEWLKRNGGKTASTVRISLGVASSFADVYRFMHFAQQFQDRGAGDYGPLPALDPHAASEPDAA